MLDKCCFKLNAEVEGGMMSLNTQVVSSHLPVCFEVSPSFTLKSEVVNGNITIFTEHSKTLALHFEPICETYLNWTNFVDKDGIIFMGADGLIFQVQKIQLNNDDIL